jgi:RNA polymerase sigma-54 factor
MLAEIRALDPKPGLAFGHEPVAVAVADIVVREAGDGGWTVELNDEVLPRVLVNRTYYAQITGNGSKLDRKYIVDCMQQASWLEKSLDQRARTILKVAGEIVAQQDAFLRHGVTRLKPLNLRAVADNVGVHESTVSRATANKYMATPRGLFELKFFFSTAIMSSGGGDDHSSEAVKHRIRQLVDAEPADAVLSDDAIVDLLQKDGIVIARRTVAKYRDLLKIPSSVQRRRQKRQATAG